MKKIYLLFFLVIAGIGLRAQTISVVANPGTSGNIVLGGSNYHASESIYTNTELGANFLTPATSIQRVNFFLNIEGVPTTVPNFRIYMRNVPAATTTFTSGIYTTVGYTLVYDGVFNAVIGTTGIAGVTLTTPFARTAGTNLQVLIERLDNVVHAGNSFFAAVGNSGDVAATSSRRYNGVAAPVSGTTSLTATAFRPAIQFVRTLPIDASLTDLIDPNISCFNTPQTIQVEITNAGTNNIAVGAAAVTLKVRGPNTYTGTRNNTSVILPGASQLVSFSGINLNNGGSSIDTAIVVLAGDGSASNDSIITTTLTASTLGAVISTYPLLEDAETTFPVFGYIQLVAGANQLWALQTGNYTNADQTVPLVPRAPGTRFYLFDSYSGAGSSGFISRLFSNCIKMPSTLGGNPPPVTTMSFWMSQDSLFSNILSPNYSPDSLYVTVSTDKGLTWTRLLPGFGRIDPTLLVPTWRQRVVNLSAFNGQTIQIGFEGVSKFGNAFGLDDINISFSGLAPVSLLNFDARRSGSVNNLNWSTSQEVNSSKFIVERSNDGRSFAEIGRIAAAGNSSATRNYNFVDASPVKGINYYRLRMVDIDNSYGFSAVKNVKNLGAADMVIAPNPVQQNMKFVIDAEKAERAIMVITDLSGKRIYNGTLNVQAGTNNFSVPVNQFAKGSYIVRIQLADQTIVRHFNKL